jgi:hypothetical protein
MKLIKEVATTAALSLALSGQALAQGSLGNSGASGAPQGSAVQSAPSALDASKGAVESTPSSGRGFGSSITDSAGTPVTTPNGNPVRDSATEGSGRTAPAAPNSR